MLKYCDNRTREGKDAPTRCGGPLLVFGTVGCRLNRTTRHWRPTRPQLKLRAERTKRMKVQWRLVREEMSLRASHGKGVSFREAAHYQRERTLPNASASLAVEG